ncbi:MAG TPA: AAA family ATPase [Pedobacter sp.]|uniref:AAA family ATPase n=1 Tax=Pedobacter sp. TaxID=1411316 RepID=UPI002C7D3356|nr:AAA family ATPase [Pedobacter sp.]HMI05740.1 AAA family ATPase [Pedobacter sp.]
MDYIEIRGYKSIKDAKIDLKPVNILIGANGSGKSNFVSFFEFLNNLYERKLTEYINLRGGVERILHKGTEITDTLYFRTEFKNGLNGYTAKLKKADEGFIFTDENLPYKGSDGRNIANFSNEARIKITDNYRAKYVMEYLNNLKKYHFHDIGRNSPFTKMSHIQDDAYFLYQNGENVAAFLFFIRTNHQIVYNRIIKVIQSIAPYFSDFFFQPNENGFIRLQWQDKYSSTTYGVGDLSDGTIRFIALTTLFLQPTLPDSIIIDEPELGLHPFAIAKLAGMIQSAAEKGCQVIVATQSTDLIAHFQPEDIITVDQIEGESKFHRLDSASLSVWLNDYTIDDLWKRAIIKGGQPQ